MILKPLNDQTPNQMAAKSDGITDRDIKAKMIAIKGGRIEIQPGITFRLSWCTDCSFCISWIETFPFSETEICLKYADSFDILLGKIVRPFIRRNTSLFCEKLPE